MTDDSVMVTEPRFSVLSIRNDLWNSPYRAGMMTRSPFLKGRERMEHFSEKFAASILNINLFA
jgi:hypothetical protein